MPSQLSRRHFLLSAAASAATLRYAAAKKAPASERLRVGVIGVAGQGAHDTNAVAAAKTNDKAIAEIVALCDVDTKRKEVGQQREKFPRAKFYADFRKMLDAGGLDAVIVATPDHSHAIPTLTALRAGLHVFCEKPLTHTVEEARLVAKTAAKLKRVTQMGTLIHAGDNYRRVVELIQANAIGPVREVHVWCAKSWGGGDRPKETPKVPDGLDWQLWLGPAPERPYHGCYVPFYWRHWWDFGGGTLNDMACHYMDLPFWALKLRHPTKVTSAGPEPHPETAAKWLEVAYEFPARGKLPPVHFTWYDGGHRPKRMASDKMPKWGDGVLFVGSKGMLLADYNNHRLLPEERFRDYKRPPQTIKPSVGHYKEWVEACKSGGPTTCNFDYSAALTEAVLLGTVAYRLGKPIKWNAKEMKADDSGADRYLRKEYRKPWKL
jgi:predicted dehydrogenase